jgi:hypothetical protein
MVNAHSVLRLTCLFSFLTDKISPAARFVKGTNVVETTCEAASAAGLFRMVGHFITQRVANTDSISLYILAAKGQPAAPDEKEHGPYKLRFSKLEVSVLCEVNGFAD